MSFIDWIPIIIRWIFLGALIALWQWRLASRLNFRAWADAAKPIELGALSYFGVIFLLAVVELVFFVRMFQPGKELLPWLYIILGYNAAGWLCSLLLFVVAPVLIVQLMKKHLTKPLLAAEARLAVLRADPEQAFSKEGVELLLRDLAILMRRFPARLHPQLEKLRQECLSITAKPPPSVCIRRAMDSLKRGASSDALIWLQRWDPNSLETMLVRLESHVWRDCLQQTERQPGELREELLQLTAELPQEEGIKAEARGRMVGSRTLRRRRAILEFYHGSPELANQILEHDWEATNWLRTASAQASGSQSHDHKSQ